MSRNPPSFTRKPRLVTGITGNHAGPVLFPQASARAFEKRMGGKFVARALKNHNVWLAVAYLGLIFLMARAYS